MARESRFRSLSPDERQLIREVHRRYARQTDFEPGCCLSIFNQEEIDYLVRWGHWMQALFDGSIEPLTEAQARFVDVAKDRAEPTTGPESLWWRYKERKRLEECNDELVRHGAEYEWHNPGEDWFRREDHEKMSPYYRG